MGVTTKKYIIPITNGEIIFPRKIPNLNQILFKGVRILDSRSPRIKNIIEIIKDQNRILPSFINGQKEIIIKTIKNTIPKLRFELILMSSI